jgi:hypothetical protein
MKIIMLSAAFLLVVLTGACQANNAKKMTGNTRSAVSKIPAALQGNWMYGNFSTTEYWSQDPSTYLGNALQFAIAFTFSSNGTYVQYFTSSSVVAGIPTYQQSVTKGKVVMDSVNKTITTYPYTSHYKRTKNGKLAEERDLLKTELSAATTYSYSTGTEAGGTRSVQLTMKGTNSPLTFLQKF